MLTEKHKAILFVDRYRNAATDAWKGWDNYKGLRIHAFDGLHDFVAKKIVEVLGPGAAVLDLGAGSGAMSARLADLGFAVTAMDVVPENFRLHDSVPFIAANLNDAFADKVDTAPEGIVAVEILEHLENPRHFVRECYRALKPGGYLLLSTPNVDSPVSKSLLIRYGRFKYFGDDHYIGSGHIVPISQWLLKKALSEAGFAVRWLRTFGDPYKGMKWLSRTRLLALLVAALSPEEPKRLAGEILVLLAQKSLIPNHSSATRPLPMRPDQLAIGIISCERGAITQRCLNSIRSCTVAPYHIYIVDNGSRSENTKSHLDQWEGQRDVTVKRLDSNHGPSAARNHILNMVGRRHEIIAMLDNDVVILDGWDRAIEPALSEGFSVVQPKLLNPDRETVDRGPTRAWPVNWLAHPEYVGRGAARNAPEVSERRTVEIFGTAAVIHRKVLEATGGYDDRIWIGEDYDLAYRAAAAGFVACYEPSCEMVHDHGYDFEYDQIRFDPLPALVSHALLWEKHKRLLLPHSAVRFYLYLVENNRAMFIPHKSRWDAFFARAWRRAVRGYFDRRYGDVWPSREAGERATEDLLDRLHSRFPALDFRRQPWASVPNGIGRAYSTSLIHEN